MEHEQLSEEASYWWFIGTFINYMKQYGLNELLRDVQEVDPTFFEKDEDVVF